MKRIEKFNYNSIAKKPKIQDEDEIWGEDIEFDEIDKCITLASQQISESQSSCVHNNVITYDKFTRKLSACSTQAFLPPAAPSTSKNTPLQTQRNILNSSSASVSTVITKNITPMEFQQKLLQDIKKLEEQHRILVEQCETKDGEISILRSQLKQAQKTADNEKIQKLQHLEGIQQQWNDKYTLVCKDKENVKCELDLKNLEIINLREKIRELKVQRPNLNDSVNGFMNKDFGLSQSFRNKRSNSSSLPASKRNINNQTEVTLCSHYHIPLMNTQDYPLRNLIPESLFESCTGEHNDVIKLKHFFDGANLTRYNQSQHDGIINFKPPKINNINLSVEYFFTELIALRDSTSDDLNLPSVISSMNKIILVARELSLNFSNKLKKVEQNVTNEDIRHMNDQYLYGEINVINNSHHYCIFSPKSWYSDELGMELRRCIGVLSALALHNLYLHNCLTGQNKIQLGNNNPHLQILTNDNLNDCEINCDILNIILDIMKNIGSIRRAHRFCGFISSVLSLLTSLLCRTELSDNCYLLLHSIFQQIVFARPTALVLDYISLLLRQMSYHDKFITLLCKNAKTTSFRKSKNSFIFTEDTCTFQILAILLESYKKNIYFAHDLISFLSNAITTNSLWLYSQDSIRCECLFRFSSTAINVLYNLMNESLKDKANIEPNVLKVYRTIFQKGLTILCVLTYRCPDVILGWFKYYSQYLSWIEDISEATDSLHLNCSQNLARETLLLRICNDGLNDDNLTSTDACDVVKNDGILEMEIPKINFI